MLKSIDVLIGLAVVMVIGSFAVTLLTQAVTSLVNTRGRHLFRGLVDIIRQVDPSLERKIAEEISRSILQHPVVSEVYSRLGSVVSREEFTSMLLDFADDEGVQKLSQAARDVLRDALRKNGVDDPAQTLRNIRDFALRLEKSNPELANNTRMNLAILHEAPGAFVAKINAWFDQTVDRVSLRFTASTHLITLVLAIFAALVVQMDVIAIVNRLYSDPALRQKLVESGTKLSADTASNTGSTGAVTKSTPATNPPPSSPPGDQGFILNDRVVADVDSILGATGVFSVPGWKWIWVGGYVPIPAWTSFNLQKLLGVFLSAALLSLGAPFWYDTLKSTLKLRSTLAENDKAQREERQTTQESSQPSGATPQGAVIAGTSALAGERGDLGAVG